MKKLGLISTVVLAAIGLTSCGGNDVKDETAPDILGYGDLTGVVNQNCDLLKGVTAVDDVDGDLTDKIEVSVMPSMNVNDGVVKPSVPGDYEITYTVTDEAGNEANAYASLVVTKALGEEEIYKEYDFSSVSNNGYETYFNESVTGTANLVRGNYQINVTESSGTDWHIKFEKNLTTKVGSDYKLTYTFTSNVAGDVIINGERKAIVVGANEITRTLTATTDSTYTELQLGLLSGPFEINISKVSVDEITGTDEYNDITPDNFSFDGEGKVYTGFDGGSEGTLTKTADSATMNITKRGQDNGVWQSKLFIKTGVDLKASKKYRISLDIESVNGYQGGYEICYNNGDVEKGVTALYGLKLTAGVKETVSTTITLEGNKDDLILQLQLGQLDGQTNTVTVSNLVIEEITGDKTTVTTNNVFTPEGFGTYNDLSNGAEGYLYASNNKLVYEVVSFGLTDWHNKMYVEKINLQSDKIYTIKFTAKSDKALSCALFLNVYGKWDPRLTATVNFTTTETEFEFKVPQAFAADMDFEILWQFGSEANKALGSAKIEFTNLQIIAQDYQ